MNKKVKYIHTERAHNMKTPNIVVPMLLKNLAPHSVVDVGCGLGTWLCAFKSMGITDLLGLDGKWYNPNLLFKYIDKSEFMCVDLEQPIVLSKRYDLVISLEVAEHIAPKHADDFVQSLVNMGDVILFSAAIPRQGGFNHVNEQWPAYWAEKFEKYGYHFFDVIRPQIWNNAEVDIHYKQNMFLVSLSLPGSWVDMCGGGGALSLIHPDFLLKKYHGIRKFVPPVLEDFLRNIYYKNSIKIS
jgi:SAM-dependent methyltransferase